MPCDCNEYQRTQACYHTGYKPTFKEPLPAVPQKVPMNNFTGKVLDDVAAERHRQLQLWGEQTHTPLLWYAILGEEYGEVGKELADGQTKLDKGAYRKELIQVAAVAVAAVESLDKWEE